MATGMPSPLLKLRQERHGSGRIDESQGHSPFVASVSFKYTLVPFLTELEDSSGSARTIDMALLRSLRAPFRTIHSTENSEEPR